MSETFVSSGTDHPQRIGPYRILEVIGEGGMGIVYLAEQHAPVQRRVALKVIKLGMDTKAVIARFEAERQTLAMMEHSCIAHVFDAGVSQDGRPYFVMEYIKGLPITDYCDQNMLSLAGRIALFRKVCSAVQHAHQRGILHRDLKPSNILVTLQDGEPEPRIIDFGLAKALYHRLVDATIFTEQGQLIGTPEYMSPEQAGLGSLGVDARTDVYSLGVLLYELLTGSLPFSRRELRDAAMFELQRVIREKVPPKPSTKITSLGASADAAAHLRQLDAKTLRRRLSGPIDCIVMQALEKDRTRRYATPLELAQDLERSLAGQRIGARSLPSWSRLPKRLRWPTGLATLAAAAVALFLLRPWLTRLFEPNTFVLAVAVNPPDASVYLNGVRVGSGDRRPLELDFSRFGRALIQCTHPDYLPVTEWFARDKVQQMAEGGMDLRITLLPR